MSTISPPSTTAAALSIRALSQELDKLQESFVRRSSPLDSHSHSRFSSPGVHRSPGFSMGDTTALYGAPRPYPSVSSMPEHDIRTSFQNRMAHTEYTVGIDGYGDTIPSSESQLHSAPPGRLFRPQNPNLSMHTLREGPDAFIGSVGQGVLPAMTPDRGALPYHRATGIDVNHSPSQLVGSPSPAAVRVIAKLDALERTLLALQENNKTKIAAALTPQPQRAPIKDMVDTLTEALHAEKEQSARALEAAQEAQRAVATLERKLEDALSEAHRVKAKSPSSARVGRTEADVTPESSSGMALVSLPATQPSQASPTNVAAHHDMQQVDDIAAKVPSPLVPRVNTEVVTAVTKEEVIVEAEKTVPSSNKVASHPNKEVAPSAAELNTAPLPQQSATIPAAVQQESPVLAQIVPRPEATPEPKSDGAQQQGDISRTSALQPSPAVAPALQTHAASPVSTALQKTEEQGGTADHSAFAPTQQEDKPATVHQAQSEPVSTVQPNQNPEDAQQGAGLLADTMSVNGPKPGLPVALEIVAATAVDTEDKRAPALENPPVLALQVQDNGAPPVQPNTIQSPSTTVAALAPLDTTPESSATSGAAPQEPPSSGSPPVSSTLQPSPPARKKAGISSPLTASEPTAFPLNPAVPESSAPSSSIASEPAGNGTAAAVTPSAAIESKIPESAAVPLSTGAPQQGPVENGAASTGLSASVAKVDGAPAPTSPTKAADPPQSAPPGSAAETPRETETPAPVSDEQMIAFLLKMLNGVVFTKHCRRGWPHKRMFWLDVSTEDLLFCWGKPEAGITNPQPDGFSPGDVQRVTLGQLSDVLRRSGNKKSANKYFTFHFDGRTLDFEAESEGEAAYMLTMMRAILADPDQMQEALVYIGENGLWAPPQAN